MQYFIKGIELILDENSSIDVNKVYFDKSVGYFKYQGKYLHRIIIGAKKGQIVDHINRNKTDNRITNLRIVSSALNNYNKIIDNKLGRGIYFDKYGNRYRAVISHNNRTEKLGSFKDINKAKLAYNKRALELYGDDAFIHNI